MTSVLTYSRTQSVIYVADNALRCLKDIIRESGLDPEKMVSSHESYMHAIETWLESEHLDRIVLEIIHPETGDLITRWDIDVEYDWGASDATFWVDTDQLKWAIRKAGVVPSYAEYGIVLITKHDRPEIPGWSSCNLRSTDGMIRQSLGSTIEHCGLGASASYWRSA